VLEQLPGGFDLILGTEWLKQHAVSLHFETAGPGFAVITQAGRQVKLHPEIGTADKPLPPNSHLDEPDVRLLNAKQFAKAKRVAKIAFALLVSPVEEELPEKGVPDELRPVLVSYKDRFEPLPAGLPPERPVGHVIPLEAGAQPPQKRMYRLSPREKEEVEKQISYLLEQGWIEPSTSPFGSPILFVQKKDGGLRMCVDHRALQAHYQESVPAPSH
jgi:hypothetical protein